MASSVGSLNKISSGGLSLATWITAAALFAIVVALLGYVYTNISANLGWGSSNVRFAGLQPTHLPLATLTASQNPLLAFPCPSAPQICKISRWGVFYFQLGALASFSLLYAIPFFVDDAFADDVSMRTIVLTGSNLLFITLAHVSYALAKYWSAFLVLVSLTMHIVVVPLATAFANENPNNNTAGAGVGIANAVPTFVFTVLLHVVMEFIFRVDEAQHRFIWSELAGAREVSC